MNTLSKAALLACTAFALTACGGDEVADALNIGAPRARIVNAMPDGPSLQLYRNSDLQSDAGTPAYEESSKYFDTVETTSTWSVRDAASGVQVGSTSMRVAGSTRYTLVAFPGSGTQADIVQVSDPYDIGDDSARVRVVNGSTGAGTFDLYLSAPGADLSAVAPTMSAVAYEGVSPASGSNSFSFPAGTYELRLAAAGTKVFFFDGTLTAGKSDDLLLLTLPDPDAAGGVKILDIPSASGELNSEISSN